MTSRSSERRSPAARVSPAMVAKRVAQAHSNLNIYYAVIALMEGGLLYDGRHQTADRIVRLCKRQAAKELAIYDAAMERLGK